LNISLDFDDTYTRDPKAWDDFIDLMQRQGHSVYCVTMRHESEGRQVKEALASRVDGVFFTNRKAKKDFMYERGINVDVWIDDSPFFVLNNASNPVGVAA